jgi:hypothetical protein
MRQVLCRRCGTHTKTSGGLTGLKQRRLISIAGVNPSALVPSLIARPEDVASLCDPQLSSEAPFVRIQEATCGEAIAG